MLLRTEGADEEGNGGTAVLDCDDDPVDGNLDGLLMGRVSFREQ